MVEGLDGIERFIFTINPETLEFETYSCVGYYNTSRFVRNPEYGKPDILIPGKLVEMYGPYSRKGNVHSMEYLELLHKKDNRPYDVIVKGEKSDL